MTTKLIIFDMDGTLLNTLEDLTDSVNFVLNEFRYKPHSLSEIRTFVGNGVGKLIERSIPNGANNQQYSNCLEIFKNHYENNMYNKTKSYDGIIELLSELKRRNIKTAVVSNKFDVAVKNLSNKYFGTLIDYAIGEDAENGIKKKPAPDGVLSVMAHFNVTSSETLYVGDSEIDIQTANNAQLDCVSVSWGYKDKGFLLKNGAKKIVESPMEILQFL